MDSAVLSQLAALEVLGCKLKDTGNLFNSSAIEFKIMWSEEDLAQNLSIFGGGSGNGPGGGDGGGDGPGAGGDGALEPTLSEFHSMGLIQRAAASAPLPVEPQNGTGPDAVKTAVRDITLVTRCCATLRARKILQVPLPERMLQQRRHAKPINM